MKQPLMWSVLCLATPFLAFGQVCSVDPVANSSWAFTIHTPSGGVAAIGTFRATSIGGQQTVTGVQTVNNQGQVSRQESFSGRYTLDPNCRGGEILISVGRASTQLQFYITPSGNELEFVSDETNYYLSQTTLNIRAAQFPQRSDSVTFTGLARRLTSAAGCPAGANPLSILNNASYAFRTSNFGPLTHAGGFNLYEDTAVAGYFDATAVNTGFGLIGNLAVSETISRDTLFPGILPNLLTPSGPFGVFRSIQTGGRYIVNSDCSGGEIMIMTNYQPIQYEFVFSQSDLSQMFFLSDSNGYQLQGVAKR